MDAKPRELYLLFRAYEGYEGSLLKVTSKNGKTASVSATSPLLPNTQFLHYQITNPECRSKQGDNWISSGGSDGKIVIEEFSLQLLLFFLAACGFRHVQHTVRGRSCEAGSTGNLIAFGICVKIVSGPPPVPLTTKAAPTTTHWF